MPHLDSEASTSSERRREPERTSRTPKPDATSDEQTKRPQTSRPNALTSLADGPESICCPSPAPTAGTPSTSPGWCGAHETGSRASGLRLPARGQLEPFLGMRTRLPRSLTGAESRSALLRSIIASPSLLAPLRMRIRERRAPLKRVRRAAQHRCEPRGAGPHIGYHALSSGSWTFDSPRVHRPSNDRTCLPSARSGARPRSGHSTLTFRISRGEEGRRARRWRASGAARRRSVTRSSNPRRGATACRRRRRHQLR
jgi:hypothetical protein